MSAQMETPTLAGAGAHDDQAAFDSNLSGNSIAHNANAQSLDAVVFTTFPDVGCRTKRAHLWSWGELSKQLSDAKTYAAKKDCPLLVFAEFGDALSEFGSLKHGPNVRHYTGVVGDYDEGKVSVEHACRLLKAAGIRAVLYTTASHTDQAPHWRVVAPLAGTYDHAAMVEYSNVLNGALGGILAPESIAQGQGFYFGRVAGVPYEVRVIEGGAWLDDGPDLFINPVAIRERRTPAQPPADDNEASLLALNALPKPPIEVIASAAAAIPNDGEHPHAIVDWFEWRDMLWAIRDGAGEAGRNAAQELSLRHPECTQRDFEHQWSRRESRTDGARIGVGTLLARAKTCGWEDPRSAANRDEQRRERQKIENARLQESDVNALPALMTVKEMEAVCVWIAEGSQVGLLDDPRQVLAFSDFAGLMAASATEVEDRSPGKAKGEPRVREVPNAMIWKKSPVRKTVTTRTFHAGAPRICRDPDGRDALNSWRPIDRQAMPQVDIGLFLDQLAYLFPDAVERRAFLDWLAHLEQRPGVLPHYGWLHIAANTGTGRNWLASLLARLWRGQVAPNVDLPALMDSQFNGQLAGRILAVVDEVQEGAGENPHRNANRLKSIVNAEFRDINPKFGRQYREHNSCRWLVFSNHLNALPLNDTDRRFRVACHYSPPRPASDYAALYAALSDGAFVNSVGLYLQQRDITGFNPGARPPMTEAKKAAVSASKSLIVKYAEDLVQSWPADVVTNRDAAFALSDGAGEVLTTAMRRALEELDCESVVRPLKINGATHRCWLLRNLDRWRCAAPSELSAEARRVPPPIDEDFSTREDLFTQ